MLYVMLAVIAVSVYIGNAVSAAREFVSCFSKYKMSTFVLMVTRWFGVEQWANPRTRGQRFGVDGVTGERERRVYVVHYKIREFNAMRLIDQKRKKLFVCIL